MILSLLPVFADDEEEKAQLQQQLEEIEAQISQLQQQLNVIQGEKNTLQNKIKQLQNQQAALTLQIKSTTLRIADLDARLNATQAAINESTAQIELFKQQITQLIRTINEYDDYPLLYMIVAQNSLSDALDEMAKYSQIFMGLDGLLDEVLQIKNQLEQQAQTLDQQQEEAENLLAIKTLQQQQLSGSVNTQNSLLKETKGRESSYQATLSNTQKRAAEIRNRLYQLLGVTVQITFGQAVEIAQWASGITGVRAAFLLAILTQESNLGKNVGQCYLTNLETGAGVKILTGTAVNNVMKPMGLRGRRGDVDDFLTITAELGKDWNETPVSCPIPSVGGYGGAMGPAQFIPTTWMGYRDRVSAVTGAAANPWDIRDAFLAAAIKLKADGAGTVSGEWAAAMRYFSGSTNLKYRFYGDNVVAIANQYQSDIESL